MTAKEKLYDKVVRHVAKLMADGMSVTAARTAAAAKYGLSYCTVIKLTLLLSTKKQ